MAKEGVMRGITLATDKPAPPPALYKKFIKCTQALADEKGMQHVANSIRNLKDYMVMISSQ